LEAQSRKGKGANRRTLNEHREAPLPRMNRVAPDGARTQFVLAWKIRGFRSAELLTPNCYVRFQFNARFAIASTPFSKIRLSLKSGTPKVHGWVIFPLPPGTRRGRLAKK